MPAALFTPCDSLAPGLVAALAGLELAVEELPWAGGLADGVGLAGADALITVAPRPRLQSLASFEQAAWKDAVRDIAERPAAAARDLIRAGGRRWVAVIPHLASSPSPGSGPYGAGAVLLQTVLRVAVIENAPAGFRANAIAVGPLAGSGDAELESVTREDTPRGALTTVEELAGLVRWLLLEAPASLNGETLKLDGGFSLTRKARAVPSAGAAEWLMEEAWRPVQATEGNGDD